MLLLIIISRKVRVIDLLVLIVTFLFDSDARAHSSCSIVQTFTEQLHDFIAFDSVDKALTFEQKCRQMIVGPINFRLQLGGEQVFTLFKRNDSLEDDLLVSIA